MCNSLCCNSMELYAVLVHHDSAQSNPGQLVLDFSSGSASNERCHHRDKCVSCTFISRAAAEGGF